MKKSSNTLFWIIALVIIATIAYWFGTAQVNAPQENIVTQQEDQTPTTTAVPQENQASLEKIEKNLTYTNEKYDFTLQLPERWKEYRVKESRDKWGDHYSFELQLKTGEYNSVFKIGVFSRAEWERIQADPIKPSYLSEKNAYVFTYMLGHDDQGYSGFSEVVPGIGYKGPYFDVQEIIIPSFAFIK